MKLSWPAKRNQRYFLSHLPLWSVVYKILLFKPMSNWYISIYMIKSKFKSITDEIAESILKNSVNKFLFVINFVKFAEFAFKTNRTSPAFE